MLRLALNLASTRLILASGHEGTAAAGHVIEAFGGFVMQGNFVIGVIVFAHPGDRELRRHHQGLGPHRRGRGALLPGRHARQADGDRRRPLGRPDRRGDGARAPAQELEEESAFFGAMDGAAKFVRGDAVAGLLITVINLIGGLIIGVGQMGVSFAEAAAHLHPAHGRRRPGLADPGADRLDRGRPAGLQGRRRRAAPTRPCSASSAPIPKALGRDRAACSALLAILPGLPTAPLPAARRRCRRPRLAPRPARAQGRRPRPRRRRASRRRAGRGADRAPRSPWTRSGSSSATACCALISDGRGPRLTDQIKALRRQLAGELGFVMPSVRIQDNIQLPANTYVIRIKEIEAGRGDLRPSHAAGHGPAGRARSRCRARTTTEPTFGLPAMWIDAGLREEAMFRGYTVVDPATVRHHASDRGRQGQPGRAADLRRDAEAARRAAAGLPEAGRRPGPGQITDRRHPARAAGPAGRADLDPRPAGDPRGDRRGRGARPEHRSSIIEHVRARLARQISNASTARGRPHPDPHAVAATGSRRSPRR